MFSPKKFLWSMYDLFYALFVHAKKAVCLWVVWMMAVAIGFSLVLMPKTEAIVGCTYTTVAQGRAPPVARSLAVCRVQWLVSWPLWVPTS